MRHDHGDMLCDTCTHAINEMQKDAAQRMGSFMAWAI